jgi:hypothetical protein
MRTVKTKDPAIVAAVSSWRERYETDPDVTHRMIAAAVGLTQPTVSRYIAEMGWHVLPEVVKERRNHSRNLLARCTVKRASAPQPTKIGGAAYVGFKPASAPASVWQWAGGTAVATARQGGKHIEVSA